MTTAMPTAYPMQFLDGYLDVAAGLQRLGVTILYAPIRGVIATWTAATRTLHLRADGPLEGHLKVMMDLWRRIVVGSPTTHARLRLRRLYLVTQP